MLTDVICRKLPPCPPTSKHVRHTDFGGMYLEISPSGARVWHWKYRYKGQEKRLKIGAFPALTVLDARMKRDAARQLLESGVDPKTARSLEAERNLAAADSTFEAVARDFHATKKSGWSEKYAGRWMAMMEARTFPYIGHMPIGSIKAPDLLRTLKRAQDLGLHETAHSLRQWSGQVFRHGVAHGHCEHDVAHALRDALTPVDVQSYAAVITPEDLRILLDAIDGSRSGLLVRAMLKLASLTGQRPGNIRCMEWEHIDFEEKVWRIPAPFMKLTMTEKKKRENDHLVPLSKQAISELREIEPLSTGRRFVFPGMADKSKPASITTMNVSLQRAGIPNDMHVPHGFRATMLTMGQEQCGLSEAVLDAALGHAKDGPLGDTYNRAKFLKERREALQTWADYLDTVRADDKVVQLKKRRA